MSDISPVHALTKLRSLDCSGSWVDRGQLGARALLPLRGLPLTNLRCFDSPAVSDLSSLKEMKLTSLELRQGQVGDADVRNLAGQKDLQVLCLWGTKATDVGLKELAGLKNLQQLSLQGAGATDAGLKELAGLDRLVFLDLYALPQVTDAGLEQLAGLKSLKTLDLRATSVTEAGARKLASGLPGLGILVSGSGGEPRFVFGPFPDADVKRIAALPAAEQVEEVRKELMRRNPGFDGALTPMIETDAVIGLKFTTDHVTDLSPLRALTQLHTLEIRGSAWFKGSLADLTPLKGMPLTNLDLTDNGAVKDLSALKGMPLKNLNITQTGVADLTPLHGMPLEWLMVWGFPGSDLTPLKGMPLKWLNCGGRNQKLDLTPLAGLPLEFLCVNLTQVSDLTPLKDMPLTTLLCSNTPVSDLAPLRGMLLKHLQVFNTKVSDLSPLKGMPLADLECQGSGVTDLSPLKDLPLTRIRCDFQPERDAKVLHAIKTLETINGKPAEEFWKSVEQK